VKLAAEEQRAALEQGVADAVSTPQSAQFYAPFVSASVQRLEENARETRAMLSDLVGGGITLMATEDRRELIVCCGLGRATLPLAQLSRTSSLFKATRATISIDAATKLSARLTRKSGNICRNNLRYYAQSFE